jgi:hypothetical protein
MSREFQIPISFQQPLPLRGLNVTVSLILMLSSFGKKGGASLSHPFRGPLIPTVILFQGP